MASVGDATSGVDLALALAASAAYSRELASWWAGGFDLLVSPVLAEPPWPLGVLAAGRGQDPIGQHQGAPTGVAVSTGAIVGAVLGDEEPGEGELLVLGQIGRLGVRGDVVLARPRPRVVETTLGDACPRRGGW